jgi:CBS domain containing-hemolysin-like protein
MQTFIHLLYLFIAIGLVFLNGFFVAAEFAIVKLRQTQVQTIKNRYGLRGKLLAQVHEHLDIYLSACQLGITLASLGLGWIGEPAFAHLLEPLLHLLGIASVEIIRVVSFLFAFLVISFLHIVLGELAPKSLAIRKPTTLSLWTATPLYIFYWTMYPIIWLLNQSAILMLRLFGLDAAHELEGNYTSKELKLILKASHLHGTLKEEQVDILQQAIDFSERRVADCMQPAEEMVGIYLNKSLAENLQTITRYRFSRYPVFGANYHQVKGILLVKELFFALQQNDSLTNLQSLVRPVLTVEPNMLARALFRKFRKGLTHFAIVANASGLVIGFVTMDDILMTLLGNISDEFTKPVPDWETVADGSFIMKGNTPLYVIERALKIEIAEQELNTLSGLIMAQLERLPEVDEEISFEQFSVKIMQMRGPRILLVKVYPKK